MKEIVPFLNFDGDCRSAMEFYKECFAADLFLLPYAEAPGEIRGSDPDRILHATLSKGATILMAADIMPGQRAAKDSNVAVMLQCESRDEIDSLFGSLGNGGTVTMALQDTFWGARFGTLTDRFGVKWMFNFAHSK